MIDDETALKQFLKDFAAIKEAKLLIHGGGKLATELANKLGIKQTLIDGRRVTDAETLKIAVMVYAGLINKGIVAGLQAMNCNAMGFCGADGNLIKSKKREHPEIDFGFVGDIVEGGVDAKQIQEFLAMGIVPVISPVTHDGNGNLLNTNADTMAAKIASSLTDLFDVSLIYCFERNGVLSDVENEESYMPDLNKQQYLKLKTEGVISKGMLPKLDNAFEALEKGVSRVIVCHAKNIFTIGSQIKGTQLILS